MLDLMRQRLLLPSAAPDDGVVLTMIYLSHQEANLRNLAAAATHPGQVAKVIDARGGIHILKGVTENTALVEL